ncbi:putative phage excisionase [Mycolicibacterium rhodesiae JS60]|nr:putative phage excisionase [Mycolicibacterium rhodesiae JS60]
MKILSPVSMATAGTIAVGGLSFALSFTALSDLAAHNGVSAGQAWMLPLVIDGGVIVATAATVALQRHSWYAWTLLVFSSIVSVAGNVTHAGPHGLIAMVIAAIPPMWLLAATHLTVMLGRQRSENDDVPVAAETLHIANAA